MDSGCQKLSLPEHFFRHAALATISNWKLARLASPPVHEFKTPSCKIPKSKIHHRQNYFCESFDSHV